MPAGRGRLSIAKPPGGITRLISPDGPTFTLEEGDAHPDLWCRDDRPAPNPP